MARCAAPACPWAGRWSPRCTEPRRGCRALPPPLCRRPPRRRRPPPAAPDRRCTARRPDAALHRARRQRGQHRPPGDEQAHAGVGDEVFRAAPRAAPGSSGTESAAGGEHRQDRHDHLRRAVEKQGPTGDLRTPPRGGASGEPGRRCARPALGVAHALPGRSRPPARQASPSHLATAKISCRRASGGASSSATSFHSRRTCWRSPARSSGSSRQAQGRSLGGGAEQSLDVARQPQCRGGVEEAGGIGDLDREPARDLGTGHLEIEAARGDGELDRREAQAGKLHGLERRVLQRQHDLEERLPRQRAVAPQAGEQALEQ